MLSRLLVAAILGFSTVATAHASALWTLDSDIPEKHTTSEQSLTFDRKLLQDWRVGSIVTLPIPGHGPVEATLRRRKENPDGSTTLRADLGNSAETGVLVMTFDATQVFAHIEYANASYKLEASGVLGRLRTPEVHKTGEKEALILGARKKERGFSAQAAPVSTATIHDDEIVELDILVAYSKTAAVDYGGGANSRIAQMAAVTNHYLEASGVLIRVNVVHTVEIDHPEGDSNFRLLSRISSARAPWFSDIHNLRYEHGADVVAFLSKTGGGGSYLCGWDGSVEGCEDSRYIAVQLEKARDTDTTFAHELGHSLGLAHSRRQGEVGASFPFALGYLRLNGAGTIMSYYRQPMARYSQSRGELENGDPLGVPKEYRNGADAVYALNAVRFEASEGYEPNPDLTLAADQLEERGYLALAQCVREGKSKYSAIIYDLDCRNADLTSLAGLELLPNLERVDLSSNLLRDLSDLPPLQHLEVLKLNHNYITDISPLMQLPSLTEVQLVGNRLTELPDFDPMESQLGQRTIILLDLRDNRLEDISALVESHERQGINLKYRIDGNHSIDCWQKRYLLENYFYVPVDEEAGEVDIEALQNPEPCDASNDTRDYNGNGIENMVDVENGVSPFAPDYDSEIGFSRKEYFAEEDGGVARISVERTGEDLSGDVEFKLATQQDSVSVYQDSEWGGGNRPARRKSDYVPVNQSYVIPDGSAGLEVEIELLDDPWYYGTIEFQLRLYASKGAHLAGDNTATVNIEDDERHKMDVYQEYGSGGSGNESSGGSNSTPASSGSSGGGLMASSILLLLGVAAMGRRNRRFSKIDAR